MVVEERTGHHTLADAKFESGLVARKRALQPLGRSDPINDGVDPGFPPSILRTTWVTSD